MIGTCKIKAANTFWVNNYIVEFKFRSPCALMAFQPQTNSSKVDLCTEQITDGFVLFLLLIIYLHVI